MKKEMKRQCSICFLFIRNRTHAGSFNSSQTPLLRFREAVCGLPALQTTSSTPPRGALGIWPRRGCLTAAAPRPLESAGGLCVASVGTPKMFYSLQRSIK